MPESLSSFLRYSSDVEQPQPGEQETFDKLSLTMQHIAKTMASRYRHAYRPVHAKSHGVLVGTLEILPSLSPELAQGLFAIAKEYPVVMRFSTNPGDLLADNVSTPRGLAVKVLNVNGSRVTNDLNGTVQDFVCVNAKTFPAPDAATFLKQIGLFEKTLETSEGVKHVVSVAARATNTVLKAVHLQSATLEGLGEFATHILGESFSTVAPLRYGDYIAKIAIMPASPNLKELTGKSINLNADYNALQLLIQDFFKTQTAVWDLQAQLALVSENPDAKEEDQDFSIERADKQWPEEKSPWRKIASLTVLPQNSYSDSRELFVDERLSFSPWHALEAHRPLGGIMRARLKAYQDAWKYRAQRNDRSEAQPRLVEDIPA